MLIYSLCNVSENKGRPAGYTLLYSNYHPPVTFHIYLLLENDIQQSFRGPGPFLDPQIFFEGLILTNVASHISSHLFYMAKNNVKNNMENIKHVLL